MTLVIAVASENAVLQVSDRRLVWLRRDGGILRRDDDANKAVVYGDRLMFAYTGLAELGPRRQRTDEWIAETLNPVAGQAEALEALRHAAAERFSHRLIRQLPADARRHEFVAAGWARFPPKHERFEPYIAIVSNSRTPAGELGDVQANFAIHVHRTDPAKPVIAVPAGQRLEGDALARLMEGLAGLERGALTVLGLAEKVVEAAHLTANDNDLVGHGLMLNSFPRAALEPAAEAGFTMLASGPMEDEVPTFLSIRPNEPNILVGPIVVMGGNQGTMGGFRTEPPPPGDERVPN